MSFVLTTPESIQVAAQGLAGVGDTVAEATTSAASRTTGVMAAAGDEVSAGIAAVFGAYGREYQALTAQAQAFHEQFVNLLRAGAGAYLGTEIANARSGLLSAVEAPVSGLLGQSIGGAVGAAASGLTAAALPSLGGGGVGSLLSGPIGSGLQSLTGGFAGLPVTLGSLESALAPAALQAAAGSGAATVAGPYQTLFDNTVANLQILNASWAANPAPFLHQFLVNQMGYAQTIAAGIQYVLQNFPTVVANLPANIQAAIQALLAFDPAPYIQQFVDNGLAYANIIATSLQSAAQDFLVGVQALPAAFQSAFQALMAGDIGGAVSDVAQGFAGLFVTGVDVTTTGDPVLNPPLIATITPTGTLGDLLPILTIPGMMAQNVTNLMPPGSIPALMSQNVTNVIDLVTDTSLTANVSVSFKPFPPLNPTLSLDAYAGLPLALTLDALGAPVNGLQAFGSSATTFVDALQAGNWSGAATTLIDAPAVVTDAFLNGQSTLPVSFEISGIPATIDLPLNGLLVPPTSYDATVTLTIAGQPVPLTVPVGGTPISGLATGLLIYAPEQLALAITPA